MLLHTEDLAHLFGLILRGLNVRVSLNFRSGFSVACMLCTLPASSTLASSRGTCCSSALLSAALLLLACGACHEINAKNVHQVTLRGVQTNSDAPSAGP